MSKTKGHRPRRTCISCRTTRYKEELIRLVVNEDGVVSEDEHGHGPGRGAYVCPRVSCVEALTKGRRLKKALKIDVVKALRVPGI